MSLVHGLLSIHLKKNAEVLSDAFHYEKEVDGGLHYFVVLKKDNAESRRKILEFFDRYDVSGLSFRYPVFIQFLTKEQLAKMALNLKEIKLT